MSERPPTHRRRRPFEPYIIVGVCESLPTAAAEHRDQLRMVHPASGADTLHVCRKTAAGGYEWVQLVDVLEVAGSEPATAFGTGAGTGPALNGIQGSDAAGRVVFTTGTAPAVNATILTFTFATARPNANYTVYVTATDADAAAAVATGDFFFEDLGRTATAWAVRSGATGLAASTSYRVNYLVVGLPAD